MPSKRWSTLSKRWSMPSMRSFTPRNSARMSFRISIVMSSPAIAASSR
jgi:hypothetical protein